MIRAVRANKDSFRIVEFREGFNVVLADKTDKSSDKDSRNGAGKSLLLEIIHFCLGGNKGQSLKKPNLKDWAFTLDLRIGGRDFAASRALAHPGRVDFSGDLAWLPPGIETEMTTTGMTLRDRDWTRVLGSQAFGLPLDPRGEPLTPRFRSLFPFFARSGREAFAVAFRHHPQMTVGEKQIYNAFLLDLGWRYARQWQLLRERENLLDAFKSASEAGVAHRIAGSVGELEADRIRLEHSLSATQANLANFRVHPEYERIEVEASGLTRQIHDLANENVADGRLLKQYQRSVADEGLESHANETPETLVRAYEEAGIALPGLVKKRFEDVLDFHRSLLEGRRAFLAEEIQRLEQVIAERKKAIATLDTQRAERMTILQTHGALAEHSRLQNLHQDGLGKLDAVKRQIAELRELEEGRSKLKIERETLRQSTSRDLDERAVAREKAISSFNANSEALYDAPGNLIINVGKNGYEFDVEIQRTGSTGIENMKVFCYDLALAQLWAARDVSPDILIHDSPMFDGVDERQKTRAWRLAAEESKRLGFQYISMVNTDDVPPDAVLGDFADEFQGNVRIVLTDQPNGCLLGFRF